MCPQLLAEQPHQGVQKLLGGCCQALLLVLLGCECQASEGCQDMSDVVWVEVGFQAELRHVCTEVHEEHPSAVLAVTDTLQAPFDMLFDVGCNVTMLQIPFTHTLQ